MRISTKRAHTVIWSEERFDHMIIQQSKTLALRYLVSSDIARTVILRQTDACLKQQQHQLPKFHGRWHIN